MSSNGSIVNIKAVSPDGDFYGIKAISKDGILHDVKGIKFSSNDVESVLHGVEIKANIKALPQAPGQSDDFIWHIKAVHPDGQLWDIKAIDEAGKIYDVKSLEENGNMHVMDIKAFVGNKNFQLKYW